MLRMKKGASISKFSKDTGTSAEPYEASERAAMTRDETTLEVTMCILLPDDEGLTHTTHQPPNRKKVLRKDLWQQEALWFVELEDSPL